MFIWVEPMCAKTVATSGWARSQASFSAMIASVASREVPGGVRNWTIILPESDSGKNSPGSLVPAKMASRIETTAMPKVLSRLARVQSSIFS